MMILPPPAFTYYPSPVPYATPQGPPPMYYPDPYYTAPVMVEPQQAYYPYPETDVSTTSFTSAPAPYAPLAPVPQYPTYPPLQVAEPEVKANDYSMLDYLGELREVHPQHKFKETLSRRIRVWVHRQTDAYWYGCDCGKADPSTNILVVEQHVLREHATDHQCTKCGRKFTHYLGLNSHQKVHKLQQ